MTILVTGGDGFVGANVVAEVARRGHVAVATHRGPFDESVKAALLAGGETSPAFAACDVTDAERVDAVFARYRPTHVVHAAAITPDLELETDTAERVVATNELGTLTVLRAAARHGAQRVLLISSTGVYAGAGPDALLDEAAPLCDPCGLYGATKLAAERLCGWATHRFGLDTRAVRLGPVYGRFERPTRSRRALSAVAVATELALSGQPLRCLVPHASRDWIHGRDAARALVDVLLSTSLTHRLYNLAGEVTTMERLLGAIAGAVPGVAVEWVNAAEAANVPSSGAADAYRNVDTGRLRREIGFRPAIGIEAGVRDAADWLKAYRAAAARPA